MRPENRDAALLWDIKQACLDICDFVAGLKFNDFEKNKIVRYAVERQILVIGEAANHISEKLKTEHPEIPWNSIIGQRNILAHEYGEILNERIWLVASEKIPELLALLEPIIPKVNE